MDSVGCPFHPVLSNNKLSIKDAPLLCSQRIQKLQQYLKKKNLDGLLALNGVDCHYDPDCRNFINFILFGCSMYKSGNYGRYSDNIDIDEIILLIKRSKVEVYLNQNLLESILPFLLKVPDLQIHCLDSNLSIDESTVEDHKVYAFISMTRDIKKVAVPFTSESFDKMGMEKWPLLQAYALEDYGSQGFFGLSHEILPLDFEASSIFHQFDIGSVKHMLTDASLLLKYQWNTMIRNVSFLLTNNGSINLHDVMDPITSYLKHNSGPSGQIEYKMAPHAVTAQPLFVTCYVKEPQGSLGCARTYFFHENIDSSDLILVSTIYDAAVSTSHKTIQRFTTAQNSSKLQQYFMKKISEKISSYKYPQVSNYETSKLKIETTLQAFNVKGQLVDDRKEKLSLKTFSVCISNIKSLQNPKVVYDPIIFMETFIDSHLNVRNDQSTAVDSEFLIVTNVIPTYVQWNKSSVDPSKNDSMPCSLLSSDPNTYDAEFKMDEGSIEILSPYSTPMQIRVADLKDVKCKKHGSIAIAVHFEHVANILPPFLRRFCIVFWQRGKGMKFVSEKLIPQLTESGLSIHNDSLPTDFSNRFESLVETKFGSIGAGQSCEESELIQNNYPNYSTFAPHFSLSSLGDFTYNQEDVNPNIEIEKSDPFLFITVLAGIPGCNQEKISSLVSDNSKDMGIQFIVLRQPLGSTNLFNPEDLQKALYTLSQRGDRLRVLILVSAYVEISEIISPILNHPDKRTRLACHISCVNTCVDLRNMFICNKTCFPKLTEQCQEGWANNIIVSGVKKAENDDRLQFLRRLNPLCNIIEVHGNNFIDKDSMNEICSTDLFNSHPLPISRNRFSPGWFLPDYKPNPPFVDIKYIPVSFDGSLCKARFMSLLKTLHQKEGRVYLDRLLTSGSIFYLAGRTRFSDDYNIYSIECSPRSDAISLTVFNKPLPPGAKNCFIFTGYQITEEQVKNWLEGCLPKPPSKKERYTKYMLTPEEKQMLKELAGKEELPEGWFFNGTSYVSMLEGGKKTEHPKYESIMQQYLDKKNSEIDKFNKEIENIVIPSLFGGV